MSARPDPEQLLCVLGGASMYARDAATLEEGEWLETEAVTFWLEHLERAAPAAAARCCAFVHPSAVALHELLDSADLCDALRGLQLHERAAAVFPINNAGAKGARVPNSGSHWSLLAWARSGAGAGAGAEQHALVHYDSVPRSGNVAHARRFAAAVWPLLAGAGGASGSGSAEAAPLPSPPALREGLCGAQANGNDCGVHALLAAELVGNAAAAAAAAGLDLGALDLRGGTTPAHAVALRARMRRELAACTEAFRAARGTRK